MATYNQTPTNKSFLSNNKYEFVIQRLPHVTFFIQSITIPDVTLNGTQVSTPFVNLPIPGDTLQYSELQLTYIMDEDIFTDPHRFISKDYVVVDHDDDDDDKIVNG